MPDRCRVACQSQLRAFEEGFKNGAKPTCVADDLKKTFDCLDKVGTGDGKSCQFHNWATSFRHLCGGEDDGEDVFANTTTPNATVRVLDDDVDDDRGDDSHNVLLEEPLLVSNNSETADQRRLTASLSKNLWGSMIAPHCASSFMIPMPVNLLQVVNNWLPDFWVPGGGKFKSYIPEEWKHVKTYWSASHERDARASGQEYWDFMRDFKADPSNYEWKHDLKKECKKSCRKWWGCSYQCKWVKTGKTYKALVPDPWKKFKKGSITWPWCASFSATGDRPIEYAKPWNWNTPISQIEKTWEKSKEFLMDEVAKEEEKKKPPARRRNVASPLPRTRQDVQSTGTADANGCASEEFCKFKHNWPRAQIIRCNACKIKEWFIKIAAYLKPLMKLIKKGVWEVVKKIKALAVEHMNFDLYESTKADFELEFTLLWGKTSNPYTKWDPERFYIQIEIKACIDLAIVFPPIKPPLDVQACFAGTLRLITGSSCPGIQTIIIGRATITVTAGLTFWFADFQLASVQLGIEFGIDRHTPKWCWWYHNPRWGWNHSWWQFRRRRVWKCEWGSEVCSVYVKGWVTITVWIAKVIVEFWWWMADGMIEIFLYFKVETIWSLYWEWKQIWGKKICTIDR